MHKNSKQQFLTHIIKAHHALPQVTELTNRYLTPNIPT